MDDATCNQRSNENKIDDVIQGLDSLINVVPLPNLANLAASVKQIANKGKSNNTVYVPINNKYELFSKK